MRASMSVPGAIAPVQIDGKMLVDGGLTRNLPVDVARGMGADVIIAVNLGTPLLKRDQITSAFSVALQMLNILTEQNVQASLASLKPQDILILPELGDYSAGDFDNMPSTIPIGEAAARKVAEQLKRYSLPPEQYAQHRAGPGARAWRRTRARSTRSASKAWSASTSRSSSRAWKPAWASRWTSARSTWTCGASTAAAISSMSATSSSTSPSTASWRCRRWRRPGARPTCASACRCPATSAATTPSTCWPAIRRTWLNSLGGEWRTDVQLGNDGLLFTEFYQPLVPSQYFFIAPRAQVARGPADIYGGPDGDELAARYNVSVATVGLDLGSQFTKYGELRVGLLGGQGDAELQIGYPVLAQYSIKRDIGGVRARLYLDQLDSTSFPRNGYNLDAQILASTTRLGASDTYNRWTADFVGARSFGAHTFQFALAGGGAVGGNPLPLYDYLSFGGFMRMTGYRDGQLRNDAMTYGRLTYMNQLFKMPLLEGVYVGAIARGGAPGPAAGPHRHPGQRGLGQPVRGRGHAAGPGLPGLWPHAGRQQQRLLLPGQALSGVAGSIRARHAA